MEQFTLKELVKRLTGKEPDKGINPDECVAIGAAINNIPICMSVGLCIGVGIGAVLDGQNDKEE